MWHIDVNRRWGRRFRLPGQFFTFCPGGAGELSYRLPENGWNGPMSGIDDRHSSSEGPHLPEAAPHGLWRSATHVLFGVIGLALITFAAFRLHLQPGSISLLYLIVV